MSFEAHFRQTAAKGCGLKHARSMELLGIGYVQLTYSSAFGMVEDDIYMLGERLFAATYSSPSFTLSFSFVHFSVFIFLFSPLIQVAHLYLVVLFIYSLQLLTILFFVLSTP